jgi:hypothetical protein
MAPIAAQRQTVLCWQGWRLDLPDRWDPAKLSGDADAGTILLADLHRPRLGVRWQTLKAKANVEKAVDRAMREEVGQLAALETTPANPPGENWHAGRLYIEPDPPGRDVWIGYSRTTRRLFQIVHHAHRRDRVLNDALLPSLADDCDGEWSIFDLRCRVPDDAKLVKQRLNVGDLTLEFERRREPFVGRQLAVASVALQRQPLTKWLISQQLARKKYYRAIEQAQPIEWAIAGRTLSGVRRTLVRRRRHFLLRWKPKFIVGLALHDVERDKIFVVEAPDEPSAQRVLESIGTT